jgi:DNA repair exonuclease SbcCD nuclease subunit
MMNPVRNWKKIVAIGCTHGELMLPAAGAAVLKFNETFKPSHRGHLGDAYDLPALRTGAKGTADEMAPIHSDITAGKNFLRAFRPTFFTAGNHDFVRVDRLLSDHRALVKEAARDIYDKMMQPLKEAKTRVFQWNIWESWEMGGFKFNHGFIYGQNYIRKTAMHRGNSVVAHGHWAGSATADCENNPTCYAVGTLSDIPHMRYAETRFATYGWNHGFIWGEICDDRAQLNLHTWPRGETEWRLPV